jgi:hypothetical protein
VTVNWDDYKVYYPGTFGPLAELPRAEARKAFDKLMAERSARIEMLRQLLIVNGVQLAVSDQGIQKLNDWFHDNVEADSHLPGRLLPDWYSVVNDIALFLGDALIGRYPGLRWEFYTWGNRNASYQRHVIMGFSKCHESEIPLPVSGVSRSCLVRGPDLW